MLSQIDTGVPRAIEIQWEQMKLIFSMLPRFFVYRQKTCTFIFHVSLFMAELFLFSNNVNESYVCVYIW